MCMSSAESQIKQGPVGIVATILFVLEFLRIILELPPVRRLLAMSELGQAIDFAIEHWEMSIGVQI